ncbi:reverse transcriptase domain-containing protein [Paenibacillus germinis]|uniref:reverse transcriptase domain-containing protein n=1 Tax=Paenibacillus germinis TaxID=2654979 RepID=UPI001FE62CA9|nr:reverse transcriptase domain-containing protein [Paenibacillus germinis]
MTAAQADLNMCRWIVCTSERVTKYGGDQEKEDRWLGYRVLDVCGMQNAVKGLDIISDRGKRKLPLYRIYRALYNRNLYLIAYQNIYANDGAMTKGVTNETVDGMSVTKIDQIIHQLKSETYRFSPVRRECIQKKDSKKRRPLGLPTCSDKLLQEVIRLILDAYFDPQFSDKSHGFRASHGCQTALESIRVKDGWKRVAARRNFKSVIIQRIHE